jgi:hypothetical protein
VQRVRQAEVPDQASSCHEVMLDRACNRRVNTT